MEHHHGHHHHHHGDLSGTKLFFSVVLNIIITLAQFIGGIFSGSMALLSDAAHNLSDVMSLVIAYYAHRLSHRPHTPFQTFGFKRAEIVAALFNASLLIAVSIYLIVESFERLFHPQEIASEWVMLLALLGIVVNGLSAWLLHRDSAHSLNMRSAYLHLLGDLMTSFAVLAGGLMIYRYGWTWIDPMLSIAISLYLIRSSIGIVRESAGMLMQFPPADIPLSRVLEIADEFDAIESMHHIHLWQLNEHSVFLESRINFKNDLPISESGEIAERLSHRLREIGIAHTTFQYEYGQNGNDKVPESCLGH